MIQLLGPSSYKGGLPGEFLQGLHQVHLARIRFADGDRPAFVKLFPPRSGGLANEALGWLLAKHNQVNVAPRAAVITIQRTQMSGRIPDWWPDSQAIIQGWAVERIDGRPLSLLHGSDVSLDDHYEHLVGNVQGARICALDEWTLNGDRHNGNLLRDGKGVWWAIDFSELLGSSLWPVLIQFGLPASGTNVMLQYVDNRLAEKHRRKFYGAMIEAAVGHVSSWPQVNPMAQELLTQLHGADIATEVLSFLSARCHPNWMPDRLNQI